MHSYEYYVASRSLVDQWTVSQSSNWPILFHVEANEAVGEWCPFCLSFVFSPLRWARACRKLKMTDATATVLSQDSCARREYSDQAEAMKLVLILYLSYAVMNAQSLNVAVIGAGASGLAAARILSRNGIQPVVLEKEQSVGGVWDYRVSTPDRPMYRGLRTNLPREIMAYREKPWPTPKGKKRYVECGLRF